MFKKSMSLFSVGAFAALLMVSNAFAVPMDDKAISRQIQNELYKPMGHSQVRVLAKDGTVLLRGYVRTFGERQDAEKLAMASPGVQKVINQLSIRDK